MVISGLIKKYREKKELTQADMADLLAVSEQEINTWENGEALPSTVQLNTLQTILEIPWEEMVQTQKKLTLPFYFGRPKSKKPVIIWLTIPLLIFASSLVAKTLLGILSSIFLLLLMYSVGFYDFRRYFTYFVVTQRGLKIFAGKNSGGMFPFISIIKGAFGKRYEKELTFDELNSGEILFDTKGFPGFNTSVSYRPRQLYTVRESFLLKLTLKDQEIVTLNLDQAFYPESEERKNFFAMFEYLNAQGVKIQDNQQILQSIKNELDFINTAYTTQKAKLKV